MKKLFLILFLINFLFIYSVFATTTIKGYIVDYEDQPIFDFLEVSLNNKKLVTGDSKFRFEDINAGDYILKVNSPESKNHNPKYASSEQRFSITIKDSEVEFWNYTPRIVLTSGKTWNFKGIAKNKAGEVLPDIDLKLYNQKNNKQITSFSNLPTGNFSIIINDPFSNSYDPQYDFTLSDDHRNQVDLTIGTYNENIVVYAYSVWKNSNLIYTTYNKNIGSVINLNYPGSPLVYTLDKERIAPWVIKSWPVNQQTLFSIRDRIKIIFSEDILFDTHIKNKILLYDEEDKQYIDMSFTYDKDNRTVIAHPRKILEKGQKYILLVSNVSDLNGNLMQDDFKIAFYTETADFEDFHHRYMVDSVQNMQIGGYEPPVKGERKVELSSNLEDQKSNIKDKKDEITVRNPDITLLAPLDENFYSSDFQIKYKVSDIDNYDVRFTLDEKKIPLNYVVKDEGKHTLKVELLDNKDKAIDVELVSFVLDKTLPVISMNPAITELSYHKGYKGNVKVDDTNINKVEITIDGEPHDNVIELNRNGEYLLSVKATDYAMNTATSEYKIIIDNSAPMIITDIKDNSVYKIPFDSNIKVVDENLDNKSIKINNSPIDSEKIEINKEGRYNITAEAFDKAGNKTTLNYKFEVFSASNFAEIEKINRFREDFAGFFKKLNEVENKNGPFYMERLILALISNNPKDAVGITEFPDMQKELIKVPLSEKNLTPIQTQQIKKIIMIEKYWTFPKIASYIKTQKVSLDNILKQYSYLPEKFAEIYNIVNISQGNITDIYNMNTPINLDYFKMYFEDFVNNLESLRKAVNKQTENINRIDSMLENLYFAKKIVFSNPSIDKKALSDKEVTSNMFKYLSLILNGINKSDLNPIATDVNNLKYKQLVQQLSANLRRHPLKSITKQKQVLVSENYFGISVTFLASSKPFQIEFWFEYNKQDKKTTLSNITNINRIIKELQTLPPKLPVNENEKDNSSGSGILKVIIVLFVIVIIVLISLTLIKKKKRKQVKINFTSEKTDIETEETDTLEEGKVAQKDQLEVEETSDVIDDISETNAEEIEELIEEEQSHEQDEKIEEDSKVKEVKPSILQKIKNIFKKVKVKSLKKTKENIDDITEDEIELTRDMLYTNPIETVKENRKDDINLLKRFILRIETGEGSDDEPEIKVSEENTADEKIEVNMDFDNEEKDSTLNVELYPNTDDLSNIENNKEDELDLNTILQSSQDELTGNINKEDEKLNNIVEELEKENIPEVGKEQNEENPFEDAINELKTQTPQELIEKQKEEIKNEELAAELGVKDLIEDEDLEKYLNLEIINDAEENKQDDDKKEDDDSDGELKALNDLLTIDDEKDK